LFHFKNVSMKNIVSSVLLLTVLLMGSACKAQDKSKRPSPPVTVSQTIASGAVISIDYSQPSVKGRTIGKDLDPKEGIVWRTGANEATIFETSQAIKIEGKELPAGKYALFTIAGKDNWTIIFNKTWKQWGAYDYKTADDALRVTVSPQKADAFAEKMSFSIDKSGLITLLWGDIKVAFTAE
ncbi:MAG TPA: DUF2911 domain-containing protein, partial [Ferruginibacter sp.]|nr:DUF2911 domain-containing protein [Ferruginibacter sp.]